MRKTPCPWSGAGTLTFVIAFLPMLRGFRARDQQKFPIHSHVAFADKRYSAKPFSDITPMSSLALSPKGRSENPAAYVRSATASSCILDPTDSYAPVEFNLIPVFPSSSLIDEPIFSDLWLILTWKELLQMARIRPLGLRSARKAFDSANPRDRAQMEISLLQAVIIRFSFATKGVRSESV